MESSFQDFAKFGESGNDGTTITLRNIDKWMKQARVIDGKKITTTDTGICFGKFKSKTLKFTDFMAFLEELSKNKKIPLSDMTKKLENCGTPGSSGATAAKSGVVNRLTDTAKYTGAHKQRFDDKGKGMGKEGRVDTKDESGYVAAYKNKDTYDKGTTE